MFKLLFSSMMAQVPHRKTRKDFQKTLDDNLTEYTQESTIHGVKYLRGRDRTLPEKIFWIIIFIMSISCLGYLFYKIYNTWLENPVTITSRITPSQIFEIPFPAITVCPAIKARQDKFHLRNIYGELNNLSNTTSFWNTEYGKKFILASQLCRSSFKKVTDPIINKADPNLSVTLTMNKLHPESYHTLLDDFSPQHKDVLKNCKICNWNWDTLELSDNSCETLFSPIITNEGVCFTFNTASDVLRAESLHKDFVYYNITQQRQGWHPDEGYTLHKAYPYKGIVKGSYLGTDGLRFVLLANTSDTSPHCEPINLGYKMILHSPAVYPHMFEKYLSLEYGKEYKISIKPKTIHTDDDLRSFDPETRQCFFNDERRLKFFTFYNDVNCNLECYANFSLKICNGAPLGSPRDSNTTNCVLPLRNYGWDMPEFYDSVSDYDKQFPIPTNLMDAETITNCNCLPECNSIQYEYEILNEYDDVGDVDQFTDDDDSSSDIVRTTVAMFFSHPYYIGEKRVRVYTFETLISNFGGLLGLFLGGSVLSFFELIYFLTIRNYKKGK